MKYYPTKKHEKAAKKIVELFSKEPITKSILLTCSCARGKASKDSCLDICIIVKNKKAIKKLREKFQRLYSKIKEFKELKNAGRYFHIDLNITDGKIEIKKRDWTSGPDEYELEIGNIFIYSIVLLDKNDYFKRLRKKYLPYYNENLRKKRLKEVKKYMFNNLDHIPFYVKRKLYFHAFSRFYNATKEFLQAVFIKNKIYPIAYDKWIKEQLIEILRKPKLYKNFVSLMEIKKLETNELIQKSKKLKELAREYL